MKTFTYQSTGHLINTIPAEHVGQAQAYLREDDMTQFLEGDLEAIIFHIEWQLHADGYNYTVVAKSLGELNEFYLKQLADWTSGQNSDGLGESFEQQDFAWVEDDSQDDCTECGGTGEFVSDAGDNVVCEACNGDGWLESDAGYMCSFDWQTNDSTFTLVNA